ncbi:hypothetical protein F945_03541 [Acinetobacter rudis CIP 110305]|uniref:Uncharacterized protein n=1 Tax=Acinetobacter rudis CIP 110305 TaxID=421052 RepID=S3MQT0_9GAMM|nr:hypothetical protein F945_03541 [Acinetobacter rudis CIP 110305]
MNNVNELNTNFFNYDSWNSEVIYVNFKDIINSNSRFDDGLYVCDLGNINLHILMKGFNRLNLLDSEQDCLVVFSGALSNRGRPPFFSGISLAEELNIPLITISDPSLYFSDDIMLSWYAGNKKEPDLPIKISKILDSIFLNNKLKPILIGGSGGGFAALIQTSLIKTSLKTIIWNPQTNIKKYHSKHVLKYLFDCFDSDYSYNNFSEFEFINKTIELNELIFEVDINKFNSRSKVLYLQNIFDDFHIENHMLPLLKSGEWVQNNNSLTSNNGVYIEFGSWGDGHSPVKKDILIKIILSLINGGNIEEPRLTLINDFSCLRKFTINQGVSPIALSYEFFKINSKKFIKIVPDSLINLSQIQFAIYFIKNNERIKVLWYQKIPFFDMSDIDFDTVHLFALDFLGNKVQRVISLDNIIIQETEINSEDFYNSKLSVGANIIENNVWFAPKFGCVTLGPRFGVDWEINPFNNRSWVWLLQQWYFVKDILSYYFECNNKEILIFIKSIVESWWYTHKNTPYTNNMVWHDHGSALRLRRIIEIKKILFENNFLLEKDIIFFDMLIEKHIDFLAEDKFYSKGTNHGLDQTITLIIAICENNDKTYFDRLIEVCRSRLKYEVSKMFDSDGGHFENSTHYQGLGINQLNMINNLLFKNKDILLSELIVDHDLINNSLYAFSFMISPLGEYIPFGDTECIQPKNILPKSAKPNGLKYLKFSTSLGVEGEPPLEKSLVLPKSGWAFYRDKWDGIDDFHISMKCGFNSNYHRQDDDTSFVLYYMGEEWFLDSGLYNYQEDDLFRRYVRSHYAHNMSFPVDVVPIRDINKYGEFKRPELTKLNSKIFSVSMSTTIFKDYISTRNITINEGNSFTVSDYVVSDIYRSSQLFKTIFIISADKKIVIFKDYVDIIGVNAHLRMFVNVKHKTKIFYDAVVNECNISKVFNKKLKAFSLELTFESEELSVDYDFVWIDKD